MEYVSRFQYAVDVTNGWIKDSWEKNLAPISVLVGVTYPLWAGIFYAQSFGLLERSGNVYRTNY